MNRLRSENGFTMVYWLVISVLIASILVWYISWTMIESKGAVHRFGTQQALNYAESGINSTRQELRQPNLGTWLPVSSSQTISSTFSNGRYEVAVYRSSGVYANLVEAYATGYYYISTGNSVDPQNGQKASQSVITAALQLSNVTDWMLATPNDLLVNCGRDYSSGSIYGNNIHFPTNSPCATIQVSTVAYYSNWYPPGQPGWVQWMSPNQPEQLSYSLNFPALDASVQSQYQSLAGAGGQWDPAAGFSGTIGAPVGSNVYYVPGDLDVAAGGLTVNGIYVVFVAGNVTIHGNISATGPTNWIAILAQQDIVLGVDAPTTMELDGTFITNQTFRDAATFQRTGGLTIKGSAIALSTFSTFKYNNVTIEYYLPPSPYNAQLVLPNSTQMLNYTIVKGKYL